MSITCSVIVVSLDGRSLLETCLASLERQTVAPGSAEVIVVDNGSTDGTAEWLRRRMPRVGLLALPRNHGFAEANNLAARQARGEWLVLLNNDAEAAPGLIEALLEQARESAASAVGGRILDWDGGQIEFGGGHINLAGFGFQRSSWHPGFLEAGPGSPLPFACGGAMLVRREDFLAVGGFDADYFAYYEDVDLGWRLNLSGCRVVYAPAAEVRHRRHATARRFSDHWRHFHWYKNTLLTLVKNVDAAGFGARVLAGLILLQSRVASFHAEVVAARAAGDARRAERYLEIASGAAEGLNWVLERWDQVLEKRHAVQAMRTVTDLELATRFGGFPADFGPEAERWPENALAHRLYGLLRPGLPLLPEQSNELALNLGPAALQGLEADNRRLAAELRALRASWSWRLLAPLRALADAIRLAPRA